MWLGIAILIIMISGMLWGRASDKRSYNKGICPICGEKLYCFDMDSQGGRGYCCENKSVCNYTTWVSYNVD